MPCQADFNKLEIYDVPQELIKGFEQIRDCFDITVITI